MKFLSIVAILAFALTFALVNGSPIVDSFWAGDFPNRSQDGGIIQNEGCRKAYKSCINISRANSPDRFTCNMKHINLHEGQPCPAIPEGVSCIFL